MAAKQEQGENEDGNSTSETPGANWKRGGVIGAAALTGGTLMAITGGIHFFRLSLQGVSFNRNLRW